MFCKNCGTELIDEAKECQNCGTAVEEIKTNTASENNTPDAITQKKNFCGKAIAGFVLSLVGVLVLALPCGIIGLVFSALGMSDVKRKSLRGNGLAIAGLVISIVDIVFGIVNFF